MNPYPILSYFVVTLLTAYNSVAFEFFMFLRERISLAVAPI